MKNVVLFISFLLSAVSAAGQAVPYAQRLMAESISAIESTGDYRADFTYTTGGETEPRKCVLYAQGDKYRLETDLFTVLSDGKYVYAITDDEKEVSVHDVKEAGQNMGFAPVQVILKRFSETFTPRTDRLEGVVQYLRLFPKDANNPTDYIRVGIDTATKLPVYIEEVSANGAHTVLKISAILRGKGTDAALYRFDDEKYKKMGYYIARP